MRIAILTQPLRNNYGGLLQAYALQQVLISFGHQVVTIDRGGNYPSLSLIFLRLLSSAKNLFKKCFYRKSTIVFPGLLAEDYIVDSRKIYDTKDLKQFVVDSIITSPLIRSSYTLRKYILSNHFDCVIVGSDQVWREEYSPCIIDYFGGFLKKNDKIPMFSYAASLGLPYLQISENKIKKCAELLSCFTRVSVREQSAVDIIRRNMGRVATVVLDPTLLLDTEKYLSLIKKEDVMSCGGLCNYILDSSEDKENILDEISNRLGLSRLDLRLRPVDDRGNAKKMSSISRWLSSFAYSKFVVTDSFHGCVFSIIFKKPFLVIANKVRGMDRFTTLLDMLGLQRRLINSIEELSNDIFDEGIDYMKIYDVLEKQRDASVSYILEALKEIENKNESIVGANNVFSKK